MIMRNKYFSGEVQILYDKMVSCGLLKEPSIAVIGIGGAGCNIVEDLNKNIDNVQFFCINTDEISNRRRSGIETLTVGKEILGEHRDASGIPEIGKRAIKESFDVILKQIIEPNDYFVIISGIGGSSALATTELANKLHKLTCDFSVYLIRPFEFEGDKGPWFHEVSSKLSNLRCSLETLENDRMDETVPEINIKFADQISQFLKIKEKELMVNHIHAFRKFVEIEMGIQDSFPQDDVSVEIQLEENPPIEINSK